ncbi:hypothetical protein OMR07_07230, partial [Methylobacterium organophilum]|nr:hypothetical protein [Methylobacterium organophilum]
MPPSPSRSTASSETGSILWILMLGSALVALAAWLSRSSKSGSRVRISLREAPRLSRRRAARLTTCSSSRTLP